MSENPSNEAARRRAILMMVLGGGAAAVLVLIILIGLSYVLRVRSVVNRLPGQVRRQSVGGLGDLSDFPAHIGRAVTRIDMTGATDALDVLPDLQMLPYIEVLWLPDSAVTDDHMASIAVLPNLRVLNISGTAVTDAGLMQLSAMPKLEYVRAAGTPITYAGLEKLGSALGVGGMAAATADGELSRTFSDQYHSNPVWDRMGNFSYGSDVIGSGPCRRISFYGKLDDEALNPTNAAPLQYLKTAETISFGRPISAQVVGWLASFPNLVELNVYADTATDAKMEAIARLKSLRDLHVGWQGISDEQLRHIANLTNLHRLIIDRDGLTGVTLSSLEPLRSLELLDVHFRVHGFELSAQLGLQHRPPEQRANVPDEVHQQHVAAWRAARESLVARVDQEIAVVTKLPELKRLVLTSAPISNAGVAEIAKCTSLEELELLLSDDIDDESIEILSHLPNLRLLNVRSTSVTACALDAIARMPKLERFGCENTPLGEQLRANQIDEQQLQKVPAGVLAVDWYESLKRNPVEETVNLRLIRKLSRP